MIYCFVDSVLGYASETWTLNPASREFERITGRRRSTEVIRLDKVRNDEVNRRMEMSKSAPERVVKKRLQLYGHIQRMEISKWSRRELDWEQPRRRSRGRPRSDGLMGSRRKWQAGTSSVSGTGWIETGGRKF